MHQPDMRLSRSRSWLRYVPCPALCLAVCACTAPAASAGKQNQFTEWKRNMQFAKASKQYADEELRAKSAAWVAEAKRVYQCRPAPELRYTVMRMTAISFNAQCNKDHTPIGKPEGQCNTCPNSKIVYNENNDPSQYPGPVHIMDYCTNTKTPVHSQSTNGEH